MHYIAPFPIMFGILGVIAGLLWLVAAGSDDDGGPEVGFFYIFGAWYLGMRICKQLINDPMSILPAFGILAASLVLIGLGIWML